MASTDLSSLTDLELKKLYLTTRGPYGEQPSWVTATEWSTNGQTEIHQEFRRRGLETPRGQSIARRSTATYTQAEHAAWAQLVEAWDGSSPSPVGTDLQEG